MLHYLIRLNPIILVSLKDGIYDLKTIHVGLEDP